MKVIGTILGLLGLLLILSVPGGIESGTMAAWQFVAIGIIGIALLSAGAAMTKRAR